MKQIIIFLVIGVYALALGPSEALADTASCSSCITTRLEEISAQTANCIQATNGDQAAQTRCTETDQASRRAVSVYCESACSTPGAAPASGESAGTSGESAVITLKNPLGPDANDPRVLAARLIQAMIALSGGVALVMFIYAGLLFLTAGGASGPIGKAKTLMLYTILGIVVIAGAFVATNTIFTAVLSPDGNPVVGQGDE